MFSVDRGVDVAGYLKEGPFDIREFFRINWKTMLSVTAVVGVCIFLFSVLSFDHIIYIVFVPFLCVSLMSLRLYYATSNMVQNETPSQNLPPGVPRNPSSFRMAERMRAMDSMKLNSFGTRPVCGPDVHASDRAHLYFLAWKNQYRAKLGETTGVDDGSGGGRGGGGETNGNELANPNNTNNNNNNNNEKQDQDDSDDKNVDNVDGQSNSTPSSQSSTIPPPAAPSSSTSTTTTTNNRPRSSFTAAVTEAIHNARRKTTKRHRTTRSGSGQRHPSTTSISRNTYPDNLDVVQTPVRKLSPGRTERLDSAISVSRHNSGVFSVSSSSRCEFSINVGLNLSQSGSDGHTGVPNTPLPGAITTFFSSSTNSEIYEQDGGLHGGDEEEDEIPGAFPHRTPPPPSSTPSVIPPRRLPDNVTVINEQQDAEDDNVDAVMQENSGGDAKPAFVGNSGEKESLTGPGERRNSKDTANMASSSASASAPTGDTAEVSGRLEGRAGWNTMRKKLINRDESPYIKRLQRYRKSKRAPSPSAISIQSNFEPKPLPTLESLPSVQRTPILYFPTGGSVTNQDQMQTERVIRQLEAQGLIIDISCAGLL